MRSKRSGSRNSRSSGSSARGKRREAPRRLHNLRLETLELRLALAADTDAAAVAPAASYVPGRVLVKLRQQPGILASSPSGLGGSSFTASSTALGTLIPASVTSMLADHGTGSLTRVFPTASPFTATNAAVADGDAPKATQADLARWFSCDVDASTDVDALLASLRADGSVEIAEPDYLFRMTGNAAPALTGGVATSTGDGSTLPSAVTDPGYASQWHLGAVKAPEAWAYLESQGLPAGGSSNVVVAVIDTGVDYTHPDLAANMWVNAREIAGNGLDDDGNGFVDDVHGAAVVSNSWSHSGNPQDDNGHGTHVAGIIAASANNGIGGVGVAYNSRIMGIKAFQYSGIGSSTDIAEAIYYAVENGADVINMSFGSYAESTLVKDALQVAFGACVLVAAAGNDGRGLPGCPGPTGIMYPAAYNWVLGVMASTTDGERAGFSNRDCNPNNSNEYEILAPGVAIYSTLPGNAYSAWSGTSMATPVTSGIAALLRTKFVSKDLYTSRFIMGQIAVGRGEVVDALRDITDTPRPNISYLNHWAFDSKAQSSINDSDGRVDAGETIDLAIEIRNQWGKADNVTVTLKAMAEGAVGADPYVTMIKDTVNFGAVGTFSQKDNGLIFSDGIAVGVTSPFRFHVAATTPNDHVLPLLITVTAKNGFNSADQTSYTFSSRFTVTIQRGRILPSVIQEDLTLTKDDFWVVSGPVLVPAGVTLRITEGASVQWGSSESVSPYFAANLPYIKVEGTLLVEGTYEEPVYLFPSETYRDSRGKRTTVRIFNTHGIARLTHADVTSPELSGEGDPQGVSLGQRGNSRHYLTSIDKSVLRGSRGDDYSSTYWDGTTYGIQGNSGFAVAAELITDTRLIIDGLRFDYSFIYAGDPSNGMPGTYSGVLFERLSAASNLPLQTKFWAAKDSVFLGQNFRGYPDATFRKKLIFGSWFASQSEADALNTTRFAGNAILNPLWNPDLKTWLAVESAAPRGSYVGLSGNFWGSSSKEVVGKMVIDREDDFNKGLIAYEPLLSMPSETTYPFAWSVDVIKEGLMPTGQVGAEQATFKVRFNRDMDTAIHPQVSFGPAEPYTDYSVKPKGVGWIDARTWEGVFNVTPLTGDGHQFIRVADARAANKPWLVTGNDGGRFRFEIVTSGTEAMNLQASGGEGKVDLMWSQDDFDLLAGYNIYRATSATGTYSRVNGTVLPKEQLRFTDQGVQPAQTYYYKFRVVKTDGTESVDSNVASGAALDTIPPQITHTPITSSAPAVAVTIRADVTDNLAVTGVTLFYRARGGSAYTARPMTLVTGNRYSASIDAASMTAPGVEYYITATDGVSTIYSGLPGQPNVIRVVDNPLVTSITPATGPASGGTSVTIIGTNFKPGATVTIGGGVATNVVVVSSTQITATTPAGVPSDANVKVVNQAGGEYTLAGGYRFVATGVLVSTASVSADTGKLVEVAISLASVEGLLSVQLTIAFDKTIARAVSSRGGALASGWALDTNTATAGQVSLSLAGATAVTASGVLAYVTFEVLGPPNGSTALAISSIALNDGAIATQVSNGSISVNAVHAIAGAVRYYSDNSALSGASVVLAGASNADTTSSLTGGYSFANLSTGDYTVTPTKQGDVRNVTAYDAALVLQAANGRATLSSNQAVAADVNRLNGVTALDAAYILQRSVGLTPQYPVNDWVFTPALRTYTGLNSDRSNQDFTAILVGDVSGNWSATGAGSGALGGNSLSGGFTASGQSAPSVLAVGTQVFPATGGKVRVPLTIERNSNQIDAADLVITYDAAQVSVTAADITVGSAGSGMAVAVNAGTPGTLRIGMAGSQSVGSDGTLLTIDFTVRFGATSDTAVAISSASLNEGGTRVTTVDGLLVLDTSIRVESGQTATDSTLRTGVFQIVKRGDGILILDKENSHSGGTVVEAGEVIVKNMAALGTGTLDVRAGAKVTLDVSGANASVGVISLASGGLIDFGYGRLTIAANGFSLPLVINTLRAGYERGWSGADGFASRNVAAVNGGGLGYVVNDDGSITFGFAASGDSNLDDVVDILDVSAMLASGKFNSSESASWSEGDYNYDGVIDILDISDVLGASLFNAGTYIPSQSSPAQPQPQATSSGLSVSDAAFMALATESSTSSGATSVKKRRFAVL